VSRHTGRAAGIRSGESEDDMTKHIACTDIVTGCPFEASSRSEEELLKQVTAHAREAHGVAEVTPELAGKVKAAIHDR
jgi:predicted small metal-binding protein